jgi:hypothetical protein
MPEFIRSIASRLREFVGNRRRAPRYRIHLEAGLALSIGVPGAKGAGKQLRLAGYTRDISESGLSLIVPAIRIGGQYITDSNRTLQIMLKLPTGVVEIHGTPVRYSPLEEDTTDTGYLIGLRIERMSDNDRANLNAYLGTMSAER